MRKTLFGIAILCILLILFYNSSSENVSDDKVLKETSKSDLKKIAKNELLINKKIFLGQVNYNDQTIASISHRKYPHFSVQYHPESSPGPHDSKHLFLHFIRVIQLTKKYSHG